MHSGLAMVFLFEALGLGGVGGLLWLADAQSPSAPAWLIGALVAWVAWRVSVDLGAVRGALVAQLLPAAWMPFFVSVYPVGKCATGFFSTVRTLEALFVGNVAVLLVAVAAWGWRRERALT